ncbi:MAG: VCBS repeat-containing protein [Bacteroidia bacterium]
MKQYLAVLLLLLSIFLFSSCTKTAQRNVPPSGKRFTLMPAEATGITFENNLPYTEEFNAYTYRNFYNGGGVALGDLNNDSLLDIMFAGNIEDNALYINRGDWHFEEVAKKTGVACRGVWSSGLSMVDINGDGWLDIYVCKSGSPEGENRHNELFINQGADENGLPKFTEQAATCGIADLGLSTHAAFFDYDLDGDLDCYLLNNSIRAVGNYDLRPDQREIRDTLGGNKLYRNDGLAADGLPRFTDVSEEAGIYGSSIGFGLGVTVGDLNRDGWPDMYVSNDFFERDYLYLNNKDGTFREVLTERFRETSLGAMGADMADLNDDGYPELFVTEMLPATEQRIKTKTQFENWNKYQANIKNGYFRQFTRNSLQVNMGADSLLFSEQSRLAGVHATDWSWGALMFDMDQDGRRDIFVANGIYKDLTDQDYVNFYANPRAIRGMIDRKENVITQLMDAMPSEPVANAAFAQTGPLQFRDAAESWGLAQPGFSNGSAYGDLDNDGDLDLVCNNVNMQSFVYRNETNRLNPERHSLQVLINGPSQNRFGIGTKVTAWANGRSWYAEQNPMRGFESCVDPRLHIGLGNVDMLDSVLVEWPGGKTGVYREIPVNKPLRLFYTDAKDSIPKEKRTNSARFTDISSRTNLTFSHIENEHNDFNRDRLLFQMRSTEGPGMVVADFNGDGANDLFFTGAKDQPDGLFVQYRYSNFVETSASVFAQDKASEGVDAAAFDADGDGDLDLYVCSGGYELPSSSISLMDRLYLNDGKANFTKSPQSFLAKGEYKSSACVAPADYDGDGDIDLFVGERLKPFAFGRPCDGFLLENDGKGVFTEKEIPELHRLGLVTDACWTDVDSDGDPDLVVVGEYMPVMVFENEKGKLTRKDAGLAKSNGWWNSVTAADLDGDGKEALLLGNHGLNSRFSANSEEPICMYVNDFDKNGSTDQVLCMYQDGKPLPMNLRTDVVMQMPKLKKKYLKFTDYASQGVSDIFNPEAMLGADTLIAYELRSCLAWNEGGSFSLQPLPREAQLSPAYSILPYDVNGDGHVDLLIGGNLHEAKPEVGIYDASWGTVLLNARARKWSDMPNSASGIYLRGAVREIRKLDEERIVVARNNDKPIFLRINSKNE